MKVFCSFLKMSRVSSLAEFGSRILREEDDPFSHNAWVCQTSFNMILGPVRNGPRDG
jgi:hypothetical protein